MVVKQQIAAAAAACDSVDVRGWEAGFDALQGRLRPYFARLETAWNAGALMLGLLTDLEKKNAWTIAELAGHPTPDRMQYLLARARWDVDAVGGELRRYVFDHLDHDDAVLVVDETGDLKKGTATVGVQRQYTGTAGRIENAQVATYLTYATPTGHTLIDGALYLPQGWIDDDVRREEADVPTDVEFATKPALATRLILAALDAGARARWVAGDEVYGADPTLRATLIGRGIGFVLAVGSNRTVITTDGVKERVDALVPVISSTVWEPLSAGAGTKGRRMYLWALVEVTDDGPGRHQLLIRRNRTTGEIAYFRCYTPETAATENLLGTLVRVAGQRWTVEESFQTGKGLTGLDQHQVRKWTSWRRWVMLAMLAQAFLVITTANTRAGTTGSPAEPGLIRLSVNEFRHLFIMLMLRPLRGVAQALEWSRWRRKHQYRAQQCHYRTRESQQ